MRNFRKHLHFLNNWYFSRNANCLVVLAFNLFLCQSFWSVYFPSLSIYLLSVYPFFLSVCFPGHFIYPSFYLSVHPSFCMFISLVFLSICFSICLSVYPLFEVVNLSFDSLTIHVEYFYSDAWGRRRRRRRSSSRGSLSIGSRGIRYNRGRHSFGIGRNGANYNYRGRRWNTGVNYSRRNG